MKKAVIIVEYEDFVKLRQYINSGNEGVKPVALHESMNEKDIDTLENFIRENLYTEDKSDNY